MGVVIVRDGAVLVSGHKGEDGTTKHAEAIAVAKAADFGLGLRGAIAFVTLEPCANIESKRTCCADLLADAGISSVYIGRYDRNPRINRQGWRRLRDRGVKCYDFTPGFRDQLNHLNATFDGHFLRRNGLRGTAKFDYTQNGGRYDLATSEGPEAQVWTTSWGSRGPTSVYAKGPGTGVIALARFAQDFEEIDDPDAYDFENHFAELDLGSIAIYRTQDGHALVRVVAVEPPPPWGSTPHVSVKIDYELRPTASTSPDPAGMPTP